ncbi:PQ loop repeat-domain-containing protein [Aspergillus karnatakaensis]|uniref:PQ-loop repeat-containing protein n=1 Tax=Aspergillus karnatakaensis TaxID=1810916 RepID=UPI003CCCEFAF
MFPPQNLHVDLEALSGICGSISIACWVVVFSPQIIENFRRGSADGLSLLFLVVWLAGDVFNILGAVLQGVLPTMIILAVYYTLADIVLLGQCFYYRGFTLRNDTSTTTLVEDTDETETASPVISRHPTEQTTLLPSHESHAQSYHTGTSTSSRTANGNGSISVPDLANTRRHSGSSFLHPTVDGTHLSPATPFIDSSTTPRPRKTPSALQSILFNLSAVALVCAAGILGWYVSRSAPQKHKKHTSHKSPEDSGLSFDTLGQVFGYLCAVLYLGSRLPQILLNYKRKSTDGVSLLFFLFACIGNLTYVLSILAYSPVCEHGRRHCQGFEVGRIYGRYILVNLSWLIGSFGTLFLDMVIFIQFFLYQDGKKKSTMVVS